MTVQDLYRRIPAIHCKGLCYDACGIILLQQSEYEQVPRIVPERTTTDSLTCPFLVNRRCSIYEHRPLICRLWGVVKTRMFTCPHGCRPKRWLRDAEGHALIDEARAIDPRTRSFHADFDREVRSR